MNLRYLLDTNTCIYLTKRKLATVGERLTALETGEWGISVITFGELGRGAENASIEGAISELWNSCRNCSQSRL